VRLRIDRGYLEALLLAALLLLGGGYLVANSADKTEPALDLSLLDGRWDFNGLEAFVRTEAVADHRASPAPSLPQEHPSGPGSLR
jgi:hypothetical protein